MLTEFSSGAIIYKVVDGKPLFLLVCSKRNAKWGFPKGHIEEGETEIEAAQREIFEETGINNLEFIKDFRQEDIYTIIGVRPETKGKVTQKHSIFFLALALEEPKNFDAEEIGEINWFDIDSALEKLNFQNQKDTLKAAFEKCLSS